MSNYENPPGWGAIGRRLWGILRYKWWDLGEWWAKRNEKPAPDEYGDMAFSSPDDRLNYQLECAWWEVQGRELEIDAQRPFFFQAHGMAHTAMEAEFQARRNNDRWRYEIERQAQELAEERRKLDEDRPKTPLSGNV